MLFRVEFELNEETIQPNVIINSKSSKNIGSFLNMISANFRLESDLRGWFNLEPETPHGRFKLDLESPKRRPDSTSRPTPVPKRPRKEVESCYEPAFESLLFILIQSIFQLRKLSADFQQY